MRKLWLVCSVLLLSAAWVAAQSSSSNSSNSAPQSSTGQTASSAQTGNTGSQGGAYGQDSGSHSNANQTTLEGCLSGSSGNYTLTANNGMTYQLQGDDGKLSKHIGEEVKVKGSSAAGGSMSAGQGTSSSAGTAAGTSGQQTFEVSKVKKVSKTCTTGNTSNPSSR